MKYKPLIIVLGEPYSVFIEIFLKTYKSTIKSKFKIPILLIGSLKLLEAQMKFFKYKFNIKPIKENDLKDIKKNDFINILDIDYKFNKPFEKNSKFSNDYIRKCFETSIRLLRNNRALGMINGPISKSKFLKKRFSGITEYLGFQTKSKNLSMLIYNEKLSVSPITTHLPLKKVASKISISSVQNKIFFLNKFFFNVLSKKPRIAVLGLNPHCETIDKYSEEEKIIVPAIKNLKRKKIIVSGPYPADTFFLKENLVNYDLVVGMYHDQVLTPSKTLFAFDAINITVGLPFIRVSPDHGPNEKMVSKGNSNPLSLIKSLKFFENIYANKTKKKFRSKFFN